MTAPLDEKGLLPCPFCGGPARTFQYNGTAQASCAAMHTECAGTDVVAPVAMWNRRALSAVAPPDELEGRLRAHAIDIECDAGGQSTPTSVTLSEAADALSQAHSTIASLRAEIERLRKDRDSYKGMVVGRERLHAANLGVDFDDAAVRVAVQFIKKADAAEAEVKRLTQALSEIRELNMSGADENGHRWANSDLIEQTIVFALAVARKAMEGGE